VWRFGGMIGRERQLLMQRVQELGSTEHEEIYNIIQKHGVGFMENNNGLFVNLSSVSDEVLRKIQEFVAFCMANKSSLDEYDKNLNECKLGLSTASLDEAAAAAAAAAAAVAATTVATTVAAAAGARRDDDPNPDPDDGDVAASSTSAPVERGNEGAPAPLPLPLHLHLPLLPTPDAIKMGIVTTTASNSTTQLLHHNAKYLRARKRFAKRKVHDKKAGKDAWTGVGVFATAGAGAGAGTDGGPAPTSAAAAAAAASAALATYCVRLHAEPV
jgi:hypothetical protein